MIGNGISFGAIEDDKDDDDNGSGISFGAYGG
jgi:hypothetical protein